MFTTNRPEILEPALAARPGRAAQAMIERAGERLEDADFVRAFEDMSGTSSKFTARLLGAEGLGFVTS